MAHSSTHSSISTNRPVAPSPRAAVTALHGAGGWLVLLPLATLVLQSTILLGMNFPQSAPIDWWPVSFVCLVPWTLFVVGVRRRRVAYTVAYLTGVAFFLINIHYIWFITPAGYVALSFYLGLLHALVALAIRPAYLRWRIPLAILLPVLWVGAEFARGSGPLAFPFLLLAHGVYRQLALIQISDVFGAYGVSFVIVMVNGLIADTVIHWLARRRAVETGRRLMPAVIATLVVLCATLLYGGVQLSRQTVSDGPKIAVLQGDYPLYVDPELERPSEASKAITYFDLLHQASVQQPDLYLLPETPWAMVLHAEFLSATDFPVRPAMYEARYEALVANRADEAPAERITIAGRYCESGDVLISDVELPKLSAGDVLAVPASGAYTLSMASNYNLSLRPAAVVVREGRARLVRRRETYDDLLRADVWGEE